MSYSDFSWHELPTYCMIKVTNVTNLSSHLIQRIATLTLPLLPLKIDDVSGKL